MTEQQLKDYKANWYQLNKERIKKHKAEYYRTNVEYIKQRRKDNKQIHIRRKELLKIK
jgi:hypothetical protein